MTIHIETIRIGVSLLAIAISVVAILRPKRPPR